MGAGKGCSSLNQSLMIVENAANLAFHANLHIIMQRKVADSAKLIRSLSTERLSVLFTYHVLCL